MNVRKLVLALVAAVSVLAGLSGSVLLSRPASAATEPCRFLTPDGGTEAVEDCDPQGPGGPLVTRGGVDYVCFLVSSVGPTEPRIWCYPVPSLRPRDVQGEKAGIDTASVRWARPACTTFGSYPCPSPTYQSYVIGFSSQIITGAPDQAHIPSQSTPYFAYFGGLDPDTYANHVHASYPGYNSTSTTECGIPVAIGA